VLNSDDVYGIMQRILLRENKIDRTREHFWTIGLDSNNTILYIELMSLGSSTKVIVEPMQVFRVGVLKGALKLILVHNHPSGVLKASDDDVDITDRLLQVGQIIQIEVLDHLIISEKSFISLSDTGQLAEIKKSKKYVPNYKLQAELKKEAEALGKEKGEQSKAKEIALQMKTDGMVNDVIAKYTGLSVKVVKGLK
ncbi:MAG TPA: JAB domain-containing protein, partial [Bacteroidia bacterium]|nr:JAB domain-containing protein [Bacteroidia bacterium]